MRRTSLLIFILFSLMLSSIALSPAYAATLTVTDCSAASGAAGRLAEQIIAATAGDTINFSCGTATIPFSTVVIVNKDLTIDGGGTITFDGGGTTSLIAMSGQNVTFQGLTFTNGAINTPSTDGAGAIYVVGGALTIINCTFSNNSATNSNLFYDVAVAIFVDGGSLTISGSTFSSNVANGSDVNGIITIEANPLNLTVTGSTFTGNYGVDMLATLVIAGGISTVNATISNSSFTGNSALGTGGVWVAMNAGTTTISNSTFTNNTASPGFGGSAGSFVTSYATGTLTISGSTFTNSTCPNPTYFVDGGGNTSDVASTNCPNPTVVVVPVDPEPETEAPAPVVNVLGCALDSTDGVEVANAPDNTYCRVLMRNGGVVSYSGAVPRDLIGLGVILAVDVYRLQGGATQNTFPSYAQICLSGTGRLFYMDGRQAPRVSIELASEQVNGLTCGWIPAPGTLILTN